MKEVFNLTVDDADKISIIANELHARLESETERILTDQLSIIGGDIKDVEKVLYADDSLNLVTYVYCCKPILGVKISESRMAIEFEIPKVGARVIIKKACCIEAEANLRKERHVIYCPRCGEKLETQKGEVQ